MCARWDPQLSWVQPENPLHRFPGKLLQAALMGWNDFNTLSCLQFLRWHLLQTAKHMSTWYLLSFEITDSKRDSAKGGGKNPKPYVPTIIFKKQTGNLRPKSGLHFPCGRFPRATRINQTNRTIYICPGEYKLKASPYFASLRGLFSSSLPFIKLYIFCISTSITHLS